ncbi:MAG: phosphatase PAP2 family protein [Anaerolineae bacterium]
MMLGEVPGPLPRRTRISRRLKGVGCRVAEWDRRLSARMTLSQKARLRRKGAALGAHLGDSILWIVLASLTFLLGTETARQMVAVGTLAVIASAGSVTLVKPLARRKRPEGDVSGHFFWKRFDRYSFPSGHAARTASIAVVVGLSYPNFATPFYFLPFVVGFSRIALGIHYLSDILAGLAIGFLLAWMVVTVL